MPKTMARRPRHRMPAFVRAALRDRSLEKAYRERPPYQRNDYLGWIGRAKRPETKSRRLDVMVRELAAGHGYMGMKWRPTRQKTGRVRPR